MSQPCRLEILCKEVEMPRKLFSFNSLLEYAIGRASYLYPQLHIQSILVRVIIGLACVASIVGVEVGTTVALASSTAAKPACNDLWFILTFLNPHKQQPENDRLKFPQVGETYTAQMMDAVGERLLYDETSRNV